MKQLQEVHISLLRWSQKIVIVTNLSQMIQGSLSRKLKQLEKLVRSLCGYCYAADR